MELDTRYETKEVIRDTDMNSRNPNMELRKTPAMISMELDALWPECISKKARNAE